MAVPQSGSAPAKPGLVVILDGTGPVDDARYASEFQDSFCRRIQRRTSQPEYFRGVPGEQALRHRITTLRVMVDNQIRDKAILGRDQIGRAAATFEQLGAKGQFNIFIAAHSRGGASAVILAKILQAANIPVEAMFLFDAVNMTGFVGTGTVPANVRYCYHAMRDPHLAAQIRAELVIARQRMNAARAPSLASATVAGASRFNEAKKVVEQLEDRLDKTRSNPDSLFFNWGNCATDAESGAATQMESKLFMGSHGALGGTPWGPDIFPLDQACTYAVGNWMWERLDRHNVFDMQRFEMSQRLARTA